MSMSKAGGEFTKMGVGAIAAGAAVGFGVVKIAGSFTTLALESGKFSDATGLSVEASSRWIEVSRDMGISSETVETSLGKMNKTLGASPATFSDLGITVAKTKDGLVDVNGTFLNTIERLNAIEDPALRAEASAKIFGRGWQGAAELLNTSTGQIRTNLQAVSDQKVISEDELAKAKVYRDDLDHLRDSGENLVLTLGQGATPVIGALADMMGGAADKFGRLNEASGGFLAIAGGIGAVGLVAAGGISLVVGQAIKMHDRFTTLKDTLSTFKGAMHNAEGGLSGLGKATAITTGVLGVAAAAFVVYNAVASDNAKKKQHLVEVTNDFTTALKAEADGQAGALQAQVAKDVSDGKLIASAKTLGLTTQDLADIINGKTVPAYENLKKQQDAFVNGARDSRGGIFTEQWKETGSAVGSASVALGDVNGKLGPLTKGMSDAKSQIALADKVTGDLTGTSKQAATATDTLTSATDTAGQALLNQSTNADLTAASIQRAKEWDDNLATAAAEASRKTDVFVASLQGQIDKLGILYPQEYNAVQNKYAFADAQKQALIDTDKLNTSLGDSKATADDQSTAFDTARDSIIKAAEQYAGLDGAAQGSEGSIRREIASLEAQRDTLAPDSPLRKYLDGYISDLKNIPGNVDTEMALHIVAKYNAVNPGAPGYLPLHGGVGASGIASSPGGWALVGEQGPELANLPKGTEVFTNAASRQMMAGATIGQGGGQGFVSGDSVTLIIEGTPFKAIVKASNRELAATLTAGRR